MQNRLLSSLDREWAALDATDPSGLAALVAQTPLLDGCCRVGDVLERITANPDEVLGVLIELDQRGHVLAGRIVLQTMLGKVVTMAAADRTVPGEALLDDYISALWIRIRCYPLGRRPRSIAANLALDARKSVRRERARLCRVAPHVVGDQPTAATELSAVRVLRAAVELGLIDVATRRLLFAVYAQGLTGREIAARLQLTHTTVRYRCSRAVRRLAENAAVLGEVA